MLRKFFDSNCGRIPEGAARFSISDHAVVADNQKRATREPAKDSIDSGHSHTAQDYCFEKLPCRHDTCEGAARGCDFQLESTRVMARKARHGSKLVTGRIHTGTRCKYCIDHSGPSGECRRCDRDDPQICRPKDSSETDATLASPCCCGAESCTAARPLGT